MSLSAVLNKALDNQEHNQGQKMSKQYSCRKCGETFPTVLQLANHTRIVHRKRKDLGARLPLNLTVSQRDQIIRFIKSHEEMTRPARLTAAVAKFAPGKIKTESGSTVQRWFGYIGDKRYDPDLRDGTEVNRGGKVVPVLSKEQREQLENFMVQHEKDYPTQTALLQAAVEKTGIPLSVNSFNANTYLHRGLERNGSAQEPVREQPLQSEAPENPLLARETRKNDRKGFIAWLAEHKDGEEFRTNMDLFRAGIEATGFSIIASSANCSVYLKKAAALMANREPEKIEILGKLWTVPELETLIREKTNQVQPMKFCPNCGFNSSMHNKAYSVAMRHTQE